MQTVNVEYRDIPHVGQLMYGDRSETASLQKKWTSDEYYRLGELGFFNGERVELIEGEIIEMAPLGSPHVTGLELTAELLRSVFGKDFHVRTQAPIDAGDTSQPEPDVAVIAGQIRDFSAAHPKTAVLVVEVSQSTLPFDRTVKSRLYARTGIEEYWILNLKDRCLEVYRNRVEDPVLGFVYSEQTIVGESQSISSLSKPECEIDVSDMLP